MKWYFVGDGKDTDYCQNLVEKMSLSQYVTFLGTQTNPYAFMKDCDIYIQPSRHEGFCITLAEALCFGNPIVATDFTGAEEQLVNRSNSIVTGFSAEDIADGVETIIKSGCPKSNAPRKSLYNIQSISELLSNIA